MDSAEFRKAVRDGKPLPTSVTEMLAIVQEMQVDGRVSHEAATALSNALNAERPGAGVWQVVPRGRIARFILRFVK